LTRFSGARFSGLPSRNGAVNAEHDALRESTGKIVPAKADHFNAGKAKASHRMMPGNTIPTGTGKQWVKRLTGIK